MLCWKGFSDGEHFGLAHKGSDDAIRGAGATIVKRTHNFKNFMALQIQLQKMSFK